MEVWSQTQGNGETPMVRYRSHISSYLVACLASPDDIERNHKLPQRELQAYTSEELIVS
jgi:hypothetical protein